MFTRRSFERLEIAKPPILKTLDRMNTHKNARLTYLRRLEMVQDITERGVSASDAATRHGVSAVTARKWLARYLVDGAAGLLDKSSRPEKSPRSIAPHVALAIVELRRKLFLQARIASYMGVSRATVSRVLRRAGLSRLSDLRPDEPVQRYERDNPGELLHIDIKKLGRFDKVGHRITGDRTQRARNVGWDFVFVAVDDHSRLAFTQVYPDETKLSAEAFLRAAVGYFERMGVTIQRVLTDNGMSFRSGLFGEACWSWASARSSPGRIVRRPTARPNASYSPPCASGHTGTPTRTQTNAVKPCLCGTTSTTGTGRTTASTWQRLSRVSRCLERTS